MKLSKRPTPDEILIWCDYLELECGKVSVRKYAHTRPCECDPYHYCEGEVMGGWAWHNGRISRHINCILEQEREYGFVEMEVFVKLIGSLELQIRLNTPYAWHTYPTQRDAWEALAQALNRS